MDGSKIYRISGSPRVSEAPQQSTEILDAAGQTSGWCSLCLITVRGGPLFEQQAVLTPSSSEEAPPCIEQSGVHQAKWFWRQRGGFGLIAMVNFCVST